MSTTNEIQTENVIISKETTKRLIKDIKDLIKSPLDKEGVYYKHHDSNILKGYAYIQGPKDSMYSYGNYFFEFNFPVDYPHRPPTVVFLNQDGKTRFHPNMYKSGKMCLSILNTWQGEQWSGCQTIRSVLITILSIMDKEPLLHEPGISKNHYDFEKYNSIIYYKNIDFSINIVLDQERNIGFPFSYCCKLFSNEINEHLIQNYEKIKKICEKKSKTKPLQVKTTLYGLNETINWNSCYKCLISIKNKIDKDNK